MIDFDVEAALTAMQQQINDLEARVEEQESVIEQLRYEGPKTFLHTEDDYDYYTEGEWDTL